MKWISIQLLLITNGIYTTYYNCTKCICFLFTFKDWIVCCHIFRHHPGILSSACDEVIHSFIHSLLLSLLLLLLLSSLSSLLLLSNQLTVMNITQATSHCVRQPVEQFDDCSGNGANKHGLRQNTLIDKNHIVNFGNDYRPPFSNKSSHSLDLLEMFGSHELKTILHS